MDAGPRRGEAGHQDRGLRAGPPAEVRLQPASAAGRALLRGWQPAALRGPVRRARLHQPAGRRECVAAGPRARRGDGQARRRLVQALQPRRRCDRPAADRRRAGGVRGEGQGADAGGGGLRPGAQRGPDVLLRRLRGRLGRGRRGHRQHPQDRGQRRHHRLRLRARGAGDPEGQEGRQVHRPQGRQELQAAGHGVPRRRRSRLHAEAQRRGLHQGTLGEGRDGQEGPVGGRAARPDRCVDLHQVHAVELRRLRR
mmetsp:Transcript_73444/g.101964  ORF Transcript_73444/g.101964 Transcript_73444/m.101964 type:complete len:254 (-) Transcript_73444:606-1367(-)